MQVGVFSPPSAPSQHLFQSGPEARRQGDKFSFSFHAERALQSFFYCMQRLPCRVQVPVFDDIWDGVTNSQAGHCYAGEWRSEGLEASNRRLNYVSLFHFSFLLLHGTDTKRYDRGQKCIMCKFKWQPGQRWKPVQNKWKLKHNDNYLCKKLHWLWNLPILSLSRIL